MNLVKKIAMDLQSRQAKHQYGVGNRATSKDEAVGDFETLIYPPTLS